MGLQEQGLKLDPSEVKSPPRGLRRSVEVLVQQVDPVFRWVPPQRAFGEPLFGFHLTVPGDFGNIPE